MAHRPVTDVRHNQNGAIAYICNLGKSSSLRAESDAIPDIETGLHTYYVPWPEKTTQIHVVQRTRRKYLRTDRDSTTRNNLVDLPELWRPK